MITRNFPIPAALIAAVTALLGLSTVPGSAEDTLKVHHKQLINALNQKKIQALAEAEEAQLLISGYEEFLEDPELNVEERPEIRKNLIKERSRYKEHRSRAGRIQVAQQELRRLPRDPAVNLGTLKETYAGLEALAAQGKQAWNQVLATREKFVGNLEREHEQHLRDAKETLRKLNVEAQATELLMNSVDPDSGDTSDSEFFVALKLPAIRSAVERGFRIAANPGDEKRQAQTTLIALIAYSQYFWDHYSGKRSLLTKDELPPDRNRNIFGVPDGQVLTSEMITRNNSHFYYLAPKARENFNKTLEMIWGDDAVSVTTWNQKYDEPFARACRALATVNDEYLVPNPLVFSLMEKIELLLNELDLVHKSISQLDSNYQTQLAKAKQFGDAAGLSSAPYNAQIWSRESERLLAGFESSHALLEQQLEDSRKEEWLPNARRISESALIIGKAQRRFYSVRKVKEELKALLSQRKSLPHGSDPAL
ncbi:MAG: hypothetical protein MK312_03030 [Roseibacillus sp.]|nr:hypothetical protein [Roseibacillus sp.]